MEFEQKYFRRNNDLYGGGWCIGKKEADDYLRFVKDVFEKVRERIEA